ncbi:MAG: hypothetical protein ABR915_14615 [Thermoguttaceae bacterium]|jgi:hypothetical protein
MSESSGKKLTGARKDTDLLEGLEDRYWAEEGRKAIEEFKRSGQKPIPWDEIKARLGLSDSATDGPRIKHG